MIASSSQGVHVKTTVQSCHMTWSPVVSGGLHVPEDLVLDCANPMISRDYLEQRMADRRMALQARLAFVSIARLPVVLCELCFHGELCFLCYHTPLPNYPCCDGTGASNRVAISSTTRRCKIRDWRACDTGPLPMASRRMAIRVMFVRVQTCVLG